MTSRFSIFCHFCHISTKNRYLDPKPALNVFLGSLECILFLFRVHKYSQKKVRAYRTSPSKVPNFFLAPPKRLTEAISIKKRPKSFLGGIYVTFRASNFFLRIYMDLILSIRDRSTLKVAKIPHTRLQK